MADDYSKLTVDVEFLAEEEIELAYARIDEGVSVPLKPDAESRKAKCEIPLDEVEDGSHKLFVEYRYKGNELEKKEFDFQFKRAAQAKLLKLIPSGEVYDHKSLVQAYYAEEIEKEVMDVKFILDGKDLTAKVIRYPDGIMYFPPEEYAKGEHTFSVEVKLADGRVISETQTFTVLSIDEREKK